jgi:hypothetical protein
LNSKFIDMMMLVVIVVDAISNGVFSPDTGSGFTNGSNKLETVDADLEQATISTSDWTGEAASNYAAALNDLRAAVQGIKALDLSMAGLVAEQAGNVNTAKMQNQLNFSFLMVMQDLAYYVFNTTKQVNLYFQLMVCTVSALWLSETETLVGVQSDNLRPKVAGADHYSDYQSRAQKIADLGDTGQQQNFYSADADYEFDVRPKNDAQADSLLYCYPEALYRAAGDPANELLSSDKNEGSRGLSAAHSACGKAASAYPGPPLELYHGFASEASTLEFSHVNDHRHTAVTTVQQACQTLFDNLTTAAGLYQAQDEENQRELDEQSPTLKSSAPAGTPATNATTTAGTAVAGGAETASQDSAGPRLNSVGDVTREEQFVAAALAGAAGAPEASVSDAGGRTDSSAAANVASGMPPAGSAGRSAPPGSRASRPAQQATAAAETPPTADDVDEDWAGSGTEGAERAPVDTAAGGPRTESAPIPSATRS